tara:strand:+ start:11226 stop:12341 length:1116 start_codon:yes stop_codon:yes gene_type:complete
VTSAKLTTEKLSLLLIDSQKTLDLALSDWVQVIRVFRSEGLLARFAYQLQDSGVFKSAPEYAQKHLSSAIKVAQRQVSSVNFESRQIVKALSSRQAKLYLLKGAAYCLLNTTFSKGRIFSDIDLLVAKKDLQDIEDTLKLHGWMSEVLSRYDEAYYREWAHEVPPMKHAGRGTIIDLHHNLYLPISGRAPEIELFLNNAYELNGFYILRPAAMTLHSIIHLMLNDDLGHAYRDLNDLHLMFTEFNNETYWNDLLDLADRSGFADELFLACRYCQRFFGTNIDKKHAALLSNMHNMGKLSLYFLDKLFVVALSPKHPLVKRKLAGLSEFLIVTRAHLKKMPVHILIYHLVHKLCRYLLESLMGKAFFEKTNP